MSVYSDRVQQDNPVYYFQFNGSGVNDTGSVGPTVNVGGSNTFNSTGGVTNTPYISIGADNSNAYGFNHSDSTAIFDDKVFSITGWFKVASTDFNNSNQKWLLHFGTAAQGVFLQKSDKLYLGSSFSGVQVDTSSITLSYDKWTHFAVTMDTTNFKLYINGTQVSSVSSPTAAITDDTRTRYWMQQTTGGTTRNGVKGNFDELAVFDSTLSSTTISEHVALGFPVNYSASPATSSSLFVHPAIGASSVITVSPATASALTPNHQVSNFDEPKTLLTYINSIDPDYYIRFKDINFDNEISGTPYTGWALNGSPVFKQISGVSTEPSIYLDNVPGSQLFRGEFRPNNPGGNLADFATYFRDDDVSVGFWLKTSTASATIFEAFELDIGNTWQPLDPYNYLLTVTSAGKAKIQVGLVDANDDPVTHSITGATTINNGQWHFISFRFSNDILKLYVDGTLEGTETGISSSGTRRTLNTINFGGTSDTEWASLILGPYSFLTDSINTNIWNIGTANFQAQSQMVDPVVKISTGFYDKVDGYTPILNYKFDGNLTPVSTVNNGYATLLTASTFNPSNVTYGYPAKNVNGYRIQDTRSNWNGVWEAPSGTFTTDNEWSLSALVKVDPTKVGGTGGYYGANRQFVIISGNGMGGDIALGYTNDNWMAYSSEQWYYTELTLTSTSEIDDKWHLLTATFDGTYFKLYVDGKEEASQDTSTYYAEFPYTTVDSGSMYLGGGENFYFQMGASTDVDKLIDHVALYDFAFSATEAFELWQSVGIDPMLASNATLPLPIGIAGYGPTIHPGVMYVSALLVDPTQQDTVAPTILPMTAFITTVTPNFAATSTATIAADPATASALFHMPQWQIGEQNSVASMDASATFMDPDVLIPGFWNANPFIALNARIIDPAVVTTQGGLVLAQTMTASSSMVLPPAYKSLFDDKWYDLLYSQHSQRHNITVENGGSGEAILKLFDDVTTDKAGGSTIPNNLTQTITTDGAVEGSTAPALKIVSEFTPSTNTPLLGIGYFDDYERKAVKFNNITTGYENSEYVNTAFTFELSIKTTKADQIIAFGRTRSLYGYQQTATGYGLSDGKLYLKSRQTIGATPVPHYKDGTSATALVLGNKRIDDGQWHHIVIQSGWDDNRVQFWIDGELDIQRIGGFQLLDGPSFLGFNSLIATYASDFQTSVWSYDSNRFIADQEIDNHRFAYIKYEPVRAEPMIASATSGDHLAVANRGRALMLYWWPTDSFQNPPLNTLQYNKADYGVFSDVETFDSELTTADFIKNGPQDYYGWDIFPVDITGYYVSELVKPEAYGGKQNILVGSKAFIGTGQNYNTNPEYLYNSDGAFKDPITDANRYIDLINDIDLRNFDAIFFKNFPDDSQEKDSYTTNEIVDSYFGLRESKLYEDFIKSLRAAVDTGISLYITNPQLALDLKIVDRIETVPDMDDLAGYDSDPYSLTVAPGTAKTLPIDYAARWFDSQKNNRLRIVNEIDKFTTEPGIIYTDYLFYQHDDSSQFGAPDRPFDRYVYKTDGLKVGDEFIIQNNRKEASRNFLATPFANVKSGTIVTAFANNIRRGLDLIPNPYKNYATCIVVKPGDVLNGTQCGGFIVVNFTETINGSSDSADIDLISDYWINLAYEEGSITEQQKNTYLNGYYNIDRKLENGIITQTEYDELAYWSSNGMYIISNAYSLDDPTTKTPKSSFRTGQRSAYVNKIRKDGTSYTAQVFTDSIWFTFKYAWLYPRIDIKTPSILTRGFWFLSNRKYYEGNINRPVSTIANAIFVNPTIVAQKDQSVNATSMIASTRIVQPLGTNASSINYVPLPMTSLAEINGYVTRYIATPMKASVILRTNNKVFTTAVDEVVLYVYHTDPILYLREDVIK